MSEPKTTTSAASRWVIDSTMRYAGGGGYFTSVELYEEATLERLAATCLACRLYALDHGGRDPERLAHLVPAYLAAVPTDPYDARGGPLGYAVVNGMRLAYSVYDAAPDAITAGTYVPTPMSHGAVASGCPWVAYLHPTNQPVRATVAP